MHCAITSIIRRSIIERSRFRMNTGRFSQNMELNSTNAMSGTDLMERAFSPSVFFYPVPGALPQAVIESGLWPFQIRTCFAV